MLTKNTEQLKQLVAEHVAADSIIQGIYWDAESMRGCFIGCLAHENDPSINEETYGLPIAVQRIAENIFEALTANEAKAFFAAFPAAVGCDNKDLSAVSWQFLAAELRALPEQSSDLQAVIDPVIAGMDLLANGQPWAAADAAAVYSYAADAAVCAARSATWTAVADAANAANAARVAATYAARSATYAAWAAVYSDSADAAAYVAARLRQRDLLLRLITEAPVVESI